MLHFFLQKSRRISHTGFLHVPRSWLEDTNPPLVGIAGSVLAKYRAYRCFVSAWTAKQKRRPIFAHILPSRTRGCWLVQPPVNGLWWNLLQAHIG